MGKIIAFSGRKQAGKNTAANFMAGIELVSNSFVDNARIDEQGRLITLFEFPDGIHEGVFDLQSRKPQNLAFLSDKIWPVVKLYSFADILKEICSIMFNIEDEKLWGTDEQKSSPINHILWKNMPGLSYLPQTKVRKKLEELGFKLSDDWTINNPVTGRELLQYVGTEVFRCIYFNCHAEATLKRIMNDGSQLSIITDLRFENEIDEVHKFGGKVIRLTRKIKDDNHASEVSLSDDNSKFDYVIDNNNMTVAEQNESLFNLLNSINFYDNNVL